MLTILMGMTAVFSKRNYSSKNIRFTHPFNLGVLLQWSVKVKIIYLRLQQCLLKDEKIIKNNDF